MTEGDRQPSAHRREDGPMKGRGDSVLKKQFKCKVQIL